jgi:RNA polymerase sigma-70 factor (ECF subfamily)
VLRSDPLADLEPLIRRVYAYVAYRIGDGPDAEDVVGEVFERALRYRSSFDPQQGAPVAWLIGIARNVLAERGTRKSLVSVELTDDLVGAGDVESDTLRRLELVAAVTQLSDADRELIALRYGADLRVRHVAAIVGSRTNAVEVALSRARGRLRRILRGEAPHAPVDVRIEAVPVVRRGGDTAAD